MSAKTGSPYPLGANVTMTGVNFSVFSYYATGGELLLFDTVDAPQASRAIENERTYAPDLGHRFDPDKVLLDPYAKAICSKNQRGAAARSGDNAGTAAKSVVADLSGYDWEGDEPLDHLFCSTVLYEVHVGGFTRNPILALPRRSEAHMRRSSRRFRT